MFGLCVLSNQKKVLLFVFLFLSSWMVYGQQRGQISVEEATVFDQPSFESNDIAHPIYGESFDINFQKQNGFFKIRLKDGTIGYISDGEIQVIKKVDIEAKKKLEESKTKEASKQKIKKKVKPFENTRYVGLNFENVNYSDNTMGRVFSGNLTFIGFEMMGHNTLYDGEIYVDSTVSVRTNPPSWYSSVSDGGASGFMINAHYMFCNTFPQTEDGLFFWGFGPMIKYTHYDLSMTNSNGVSKGYSMDDAAIGVLFGTGVSLRVSDFAIKIDGKYYWERERYLALGISLMHSF